MEFPDLGRQCSLESCKQLDFLPFTCDACSKVFCKDHLTYDKHECSKLHVKDRRVPVCPLCNQPVSLAANEDANQKVNEHIESYCRSDLAQHKRSNKCKVKGCKQRELIPVLCTSCRQNFCLRHRHENDHECSAKKGSPSNRTASSASIRAGQVAASRNAYPKSIPKSKPQSTALRMPQNSLSNIGSDLNRQRQARQGVAQSSRETSQSHLMGRSNGANSLGSNMTEDEALAFAIQASLTDNATSSGQQQPTQNDPSLEEQDSALARALEESAIEEQERQRRLQNEQTSKNKDSCSIS